MSTCPPNLVYSFLTVCEIITFKVDKKVFFPMPKGDSRVLKAQKKTFSSRHGLCNIFSLCLGELGTKSHTHRRCGTLRKKLFSTRGYAEIHIQRPFFDNKKGIQKIAVLKTQTVKICFGASSIYRIYLFFEKN
jgi:16S rRNA A1518/A1519 N6-dimethyltransferase RsmA/KsgA/DIM1 with predicted DNA glycosylase/AP lyase activity